MIGYKEAFPPLASPSNSILSVSSNKQRPQQDFDNYSSSSNRNSEYSTVFESNEDNEDDENENIAYQFGNGFKRIKPVKTASKIPENTPEPPRNRHSTKKFPETYLTPPANNQDTNFPFTNRGPSRQRTPPLRRKHYDQNTAESDLKITRVTVFPPKLYSQSERTQKITPSISSTVDTNSVNLRLPNAQNTEQKKINYNYHPIIDFFEDEEPKKSVLERKTGKLVADENSWRPMVGG